VRRVADLAAEAASYPVEAELTYSRIAQNPTIYRGHHVRMRGRVYNVDVRDGRSDLQLLVSDCPRGQRCPLWVRYSAATDASVGAWVEVVGEIGGEQQFRARGGDRVMSVPRVDAVFVLPSTS
jgi:hypothetical protein